MEADSENDSEETVDLVLPQRNERKRGRDPDVDSDDNSLNLTLTSQSPDLDQQASQVLDGLIAFIAAEEVRTLREQKPTLVRGGDQFQVEFLCVPSAIWRNVRVLRILTVTASAAFDQNGRLRRFLVALQQRLAMLERYEMAGAAVLQLALQTCPLVLLERVDSMFGWTRGTEYLEWHVPALLLVHDRGLERPLQSYLRRERVQTEPLFLDDRNMGGDFSLQLILDNFLTPDSQPGMMGMDGDETTQPVAHLQRFQTFFKKVKLQCALLGNAELGSEHPSSLLVMTVMNVDIFGDDVPRLRRVFDYLFALGRTMLWPLFIHMEAWEALQAVHPSFLQDVEKPEPLLLPLQGEHYMYWVPQKKPLQLSPENNRETAIVESYDDEDDEDDRPSKEARYACAQCQQRRATLRVGFLPLCSQACYRNYVLA